MNLKIVLALTLAAAFAASAHAQYNWSANGHRYELVTQKKNWAAAKADAESRTYNGVKGHLVTITSPAEQNFLNGVFGNSMREAWTGGFHDGSGWAWVTGESFSYTNWSPGEPNGGANRINFHGANALGTWNDVPDWEVVRYVVEYSPRAADPWPMERQDRWGTARATSGPAPTQFTTPYVFRSTTGSDIVSHGPSLRQDGVGFYGTWNQKTVHKFNWNTGSNFGPNFNTLNFNMSTPALSQDGSTIFVHAPQNLQQLPVGRIYAINTQTMDFLWFMDTNSQKVNDFDMCSPTIGPDGHVVVGSTTGQVWRLQQTTGAPAWVRSGLQEVRHTVVFTRDDSKLIVANGDRITALNYSDGSTAWEKVYASQLGQPGVAPSGEIVVGRSDGVVVALDPESGTELWDEATLDGVHTAPAFGDSDVYVVSTDKNLYSFRLSNGNPNWSFTGNDLTGSAPSVGHDGRIYFMNRTGALYAINPDGTQSWTLQFSGESRGPITVGPDGSLFIGFGGLMIIRQLPTGLTLLPNSVVGGLSTQGIITLDAPAPAGGLTVALSDNTGAISTPASVFVPEGERVATFTVNTNTVDNYYTRQITANINGVNKTAHLTLTPGLKSLAVNPSSVTGGTTSTGTVTLYGAAPAGGAVVTLSDDSSAIGTPESVTVDEGNTTATFTITTSSVNSSATRQISATYGVVTRRASLTVTSLARPSSLTLNPSTVKGGSNTTGTVTLTQNANAGGQVVTVSDNSSAIQVPPEVTVAEFTNSTQFPITTSPVTATFTRSVSATANGVTKTATLTLTP